MTHLYIKPWLFGCLRPVRSCHVMEYNLLLPNSFFIAESKLHGFLPAVKVLICGIRSRCTIQLLPKSACRGQIINTGPGTRGPRTQRFSSVAWDQTQTTGITWWLQQCPVIPGMEGEEDHQKSIFGTLERKVCKMDWDESVHCARCAGTLPNC